jgi:hypothetical protein
MLCIIIKHLHGWFDVAQASHVSPAPSRVVQVEAAFAKFGVAIWAALAPKYPAVDLGKVRFGRSHQPPAVVSSISCGPHRLRVLSNRLAVLSMF